MANHKRKRPKSRRAGCVFCKPWKHQRAPKRDCDRPSLRRKLQSDGDE